MANESAIDHIREEYFHWLLDIVGMYPGYIEEGEYSSHVSMLWQLYNTEFYWTVNNDGNRASDGMNLRAQFVDSYSGPYDIVSTQELGVRGGKCSVLEMLIGLACRIENDIMYDPSEGNRTHIWFWKMIENLNLVSVDDYTYNKDYVRGIVDNFLSRRYNKNGRGGLFPLKYNRVDQREIEIWDQMNGYISENFSF